MGDDLPAGEKALRLIFFKGRFDRGSIAERAIQMNKQFPLLIVRPKGQNAGFIDFILDI